MTPAQLTALRAHIDATPAYADWIAHGNDQQLADALSALTVPVVGSVSRSRFAMWCGATGLRAAIADHARTPGSPLRSIALTIEDFLLGGVAEELHLADPANQMMIAAWVQAGALTQAQADELLALATTPQPLFGQVSNTDVACAFGRTGLGA